MPADEDQVPLVQIGPKRLRIPADLIESMRVATDFAFDGSPSRGVGLLFLTDEPKAYGSPELEKAQAESLWRTRNVRAQDWTGVVRLAHPKCDTGT